MPKFLLAGALPGGHAGNAVSSATLLHALQRMGEVTLLSHRLSTPRWTESRVDGVRVIRLGVQPVLIHGEALAAGRIHGRRLRNWPVAWAVNSRYASALYSAGVPYVIWEATTARDELGVSSVADVKRSSRGTGLGFRLHKTLMPLGEALEGRIYRSAAAVLTMSAHTRDVIVETHRLNRDSIQVLTHPPSPTFISALEHAMTRSRSAQRPPFRLLFVGRADDARKNFELLPEVLRKVLEAGTPARLTVIGRHNAHWRQALQLDGLEDALQFAGPVQLDELVNAYLDHDLLLVPSRQEGFGIVVAEALAAGLPVISTRCGGPEQIVQESGAGELVDRNADAMAGAVVRLLADSDRLKSFSDKGRRYAAGPLSFETFACRVAEITARVTSLVA